jgi:hypothetical protein
MILGGEVMVDGIKMEGLPVQVNEHIRIYDRPNYQILDTDFGLLVQWDRKFSIRITIDPSIADEICGMCGTCDGSQENDWRIGPNKDECKNRLHPTKPVGAIVRPASSH